MAVTAKSYRERRANIVREARTYLEANEKDWTADRQGTYDKMLSECSDLLKKAEQVESLEKAEASLDSPVGEPLPKEQPSQRGNAIETKQQIKVRIGSGKDRQYVATEIGDRGEAGYQKAFGHFLRNGAAGLPQEQFAALRSDDDPSGGYLVASEQFATGLLQAVDDLLYIRQWSTVHTVVDAKSLGIRTRSARLSSFAWSSELASPTSDTALKFGKKVLTPNHLTGEILVSRDLLKMSIMSPESIVQSELARDAGEVMEDAFLSGSGANRPLGLFTASADGINTDRDVSTANTTTAITADGLRNCKYALKMQHRQNPKWLFHRDAISMISKLKDGNGQYLWQPGTTMGDPDRLLSYEVGESERVPNTFTTGLYVGLLGNFRYYEIADALNIEIQRLDELHARTNQVGFIARLKTDGMPTLSEAFARVKLA